MTPPRLLSLVLSILFPLAVPVQAGQVSNAAPPSELPIIGSAAPDFTLSDANTSIKRKLSEFVVAKRPVALFFFCGCPACHAVATHWGRFQRGGVLPTTAATVIVYQSDEAEEARTFARATGLDTKRTAVLLDGDLRVTDTLYHALPCPRLLALDENGTIRYIKPHEGDTDAEKNASTLAARVLSALRTVATNPAKDAAP